MKKILLLLVLTAAAISGRADNGYDYYTIDGQKIVVTKRVVKTDKVTNDSVSGRKIFNGNVHLTVDSICDTVRRSNPPVPWWRVTECYQNPGKLFYDTTKVDQGLDAGTFYMYRLQAREISSCYYSPEKKALFCQPKFKEIPGKEWDGMYIAIYLGFFLFILGLSKKWIKEFPHLGCTTYYTIVCFLANNAFLFRHFEKTCIFMYLIPIILRIILEIINALVIRSKKCKAAKAEAKKAK